MVLHECFFVLVLKPKAMSLKCLVLLNVHLNIEVSPNS